MVQLIVKCDMVQTILSLQKNSWTAKRHLLPYWTIMYLPARTGDAIKQGTKNVTLYGWMK